MSALPKLTSQIESLMEEKGVYLEELIDGIAAQRTVFHV